MSSLLTLTDFGPLVERIAKSEGYDPEFLTIAEMTWDYLEERGYAPSLLSDRELDTLYAYVYARVKAVWHD